MQFTKEELKYKLESHKRWLNGEEGNNLVLICADLRGADLKDADLRHAVLRGCKFAGADLSGANLFDADLWGASFEDRPPMLSVLIKKLVSKAK